MICFIWIFFLNFYITLGLFDYYWWKIIHFSTKTIEQYIKYFMNYKSTQRAQTSRLKTSMWVPLEHLSSCDVSENARGRARWAAAKVDFAWYMSFQLGCHSLLQLTTSDINGSPGSEGSGLSPIDFMSWMQPKMHNGKNTVHTCLDDALGAVFKLARV